MNRMNVTLLANAAVQQRLSEKPALLGELRQLQQELDTALADPRRSSADATRLFLEKARALAVGPNAADVMDFVRASAEQLSKALGHEADIDVEAQRELARMGRNLDWAPVEVGERASEALQHLHPAVPATVQTQTLNGVLDEVKQLAAEGKVGVVQVDVDLTSQRPIARTVHALQVVGERFDIPELKDPLHLLPMLPGYTTAAFQQFLDETGLRAKYAKVDWGDFTIDGAKAENPRGGLYNHFRYEFWYGGTGTPSQHVAQDELSAGLAEFVAAIERAGGKVVFNSGRDDDMAQGTREAYANGGVPDAEVLLGKMPGKTDAEVKVERQKIFKERGWVTVAVIDDRAKNRDAVVKESSTDGHPVRSIAVATPGFIATPDLANTATRISTFQLNPLDDAKKAAMREVVASFVKPGQQVALEYGSNAVLAAAELERLQKAGRLTGVQILPAHASVAETATKHGLTLVGKPRLLPDVAIGGADQLVLVPGRGGKLRAVLLKGFGPAFPEEREQAMSAGRYVVLVDPSKAVTKLDKPIPVAVRPADVAAFNDWARHVVGAEPVLRMAKGSDAPVTMSDGTQMVDLHFKDGVEDPVALAALLDAGLLVRGHGLYVDVASTLFIADPEKGNRELALQ